LVEEVTPVPGSKDRIVGTRAARILDQLVRRLPEMSAHGNRRLLLSHVVVAHLLAFFNPALRGLRSIEELFEQPHVRKRLGTPRIPRSTLADAQRLFDPQLLLPLIRSLQQRLGHVPHDGRLDGLTRKLLAVDGTFFAVAPRIAWAVFNRASVQAGAPRDIRKGNVRAHLRFDVLRGVPESVDLTDGQAPETQTLLPNLEAGCFYLMDRGFSDYDLLQAILMRDSDFLIRLRKSASTQTLQDQPLQAADLAAGVVCDQLVRLGWRDDQTPPLPVLRRVEVTCSQRDGTPGTLILLTNRLDLPAHLIALLYQQRWQIELFFRWLKCMAHFEHFFSESPAGMTLQVYVAIIATLLLAILTDAKPSKYDYAMMSCVLSGWSDLDEALAAAQRRRAQRRRADEWQRAYNAKRAAKKA
jgi:hypothetical protein